MMKSRQAAGTEGRRFVIIVMLISWVIIPHSDAVHVRESRMAAGHSFEVGDAAALLWCIKFPKAPRRSQNLTWIRRFKYYAPTHSTRGPTCHMFSRLYVFPLRNFFLRNLIPVAGIEHEIAD